MRKPSPYTKNNSNRLLRYKWILKVLNSFMGILAENIHNKGGLVNEKRYGFC